MRKVRRTLPQKAAEAPVSEERLNRFLARAGFASRREAEKLIRQGHVTLNGRVVKEPGEHLDPKKDAVKVNGKRVTSLLSCSYYILYKPRGVVCTMDDPQGRPCVGDALERLRGRPVPAGRLDYDAEGLVLCTNDGDMVNRILHPRYKVRKVYEVKVDGIPDQRALKRLESGIILDGKKTLPARVSFLRKGERKSWLRMTLYEGRNRQIKRMFEHFGYRVLKLRRVALGPLSIQGMQRGDLRKLRPNELDKLLRAMGELDNKK